MRPSTVCDQPDQLASDKRAAKSSGAVLDDRSRCPTSASPVRLPSAALRDFVLGVADHQPTAGDRTGELTEGRVEKQLSVSALSCPNLPGLDQRLAPPLEHFRTGDLVTRPGHSGRRRAAPGPRSAIHGAADSPLDGPQSALRSRRTSPRSLSGELVDLALKVAVLLDKGRDHSVEVGHNALRRLAYSTRAASR
jgi:hypothetical protein